jgi:hypothetical protein
MPKATPLASAVVMNRLGILMEPQEQVSIAG